MPTNKNQLGRLLAIHHKLSTMRRFTWQQLAESCALHDLVREKPSERTLKEDIKILRDSFNAPIPKYKESYYYTKAFSLFETLDQEDVSIINECYALLKQFSALPQFEGLAEILIKLQKQAGLYASVQKEVIHFEQNTQLKGINYLNELYNYINQERCVQIEYKDFQGSKQVFMLSPYYLKEYNNRWYLYGLEHGKQVIYNLALDRINTIKYADEPFVKNENLDFESYFEDIIGVTKIQESPVTLIKLRVEKNRANYIITKPLHSSQAEISEESTSTHKVLQYRLRINNELVSKILELGQDVEVLEPAILRQKIIEQIQAMGERYGV